MTNPERRIAFVLAATEHGPLIVNRFDRHHPPNELPFGVGYDLLERGRFNPAEIQLALSILDLRRQYSGDGVFALDCGANIGTHAVEWARRMTGWGSLYAIEPQERVYYALAGNLALNNCFNARALCAAVGAATGQLRIPVLDHSREASFGSLELRPRANQERIGQTADYSENGTVEVPVFSIDSLELARVDLIKIDVEGMEMDALDGASSTIERCRPALIVEWYKADKAALRARLEGFGYATYEVGLNFCAIHNLDPCLSHVRIQD
ncbi:MAG: FkbM family methyltransferase [Acetobacteraceae bacterium]|nr:FkbM family methyltransferase [Pseudomonadota bacterium]